MVLAEVILVEEDRWSTGAVVEQCVHVELRDDLWLEGVEKVVAQLGDARSGIRETGQSRDERQPGRNALCTC